MIPLAKPFFDQKELDAIKETFKSGWVAGQGPKNYELEKKFADYIGTKYAVCAANCTAALHLALLSLKIGKGDEVIVPDYSFPATAHAVLYTGAKPVFVDIDERTYNIDPYLIEKSITKKTKAIMPVHIMGQCADMKEILEIAKKHKLSVIEDAACAFGSEYRGKKAGSFGDVNCFSFHARKSITSGEGGMITTNHKNIEEKTRSLACFGIESAYKRQSEFSVPQFTELGYNYKLSDIQAAIVLEQLKKSEKFIKKRQELAGYYNKKLKELNFIIPPFTEKHNKHVYQSYVCILDEKINRNKLISEMKKEGIQTTIGTYCLSTQPVYKSKTTNKNALYIFKHSIALPMFYELSFSQIDEIVEKLKKAVKRC